MRVPDLLSELGYRDSRNFLRPGRRSFDAGPEFGHTFRHARDKLSLQGVYALRPPAETASTPIVPVVYVCKAKSEEEADDIHRLVWNQDVVPFLLVHTPVGARFYSGFRHSRLASGANAGALRALVDFNHISQIADDLHAEAIDSGEVWRRRGREVTPEYRLNWKLLDNLRTLDSFLQGTGLGRGVSHALIGKYVYLHYLRDREILSRRKLDRWGIEESTIFGPDATVEGLSRLLARLDDWLNGSVFPVELTGPDSPSEMHLRCVAGVFHGDEVSEVGNRQLSLDFQAYDFSYIPIETLSVVYEQFLHSSDERGGNSQGRELGAYYTPIPVVNLMLAELEERRPLGRHMRILDPSCGSGAFLVQCFRRLIEKEFPPGHREPKPAELRELLERTIFGLDVEADACNVTELSLILTLLDYVHPPDLEGRGRERFRLPVLRGRNIFCGNFFDRPAAEYRPLARKFDWVVGNPPWKRLNPRKLTDADRPAWSRIQANEKARPVGSNQVARAFAWEALEFVAKDGEVGLFLPAMTLFENPAAEFRRSFFGSVKANTVVNFANLAEALSGGRFRVPGAAFFYEARAEGGAGRRPDEFVRTYSPLVANQEPTRPVTGRARNESWSIVINASEIRDLPTGQIADGSGLPWKLATWGSPLDARLLGRLARRFDLLRDLEEREQIVVSEGLQLRAEPTGDTGEQVELVEEVVGRRKLDVTPLKRLRHLFSLPPEAVVNVDPARISDTAKGKRGEEKEGRGRGMGSERRAERNGKVSGPIRLTTRSQEQTHGRLRRACPQYCSLKDVCVRSTPRLNLRLNLSLSEIRV